jgi:AraC family transcriptional regulator
MPHVQDLVVNVITGRKRPALTRPPVLTSISSPWRGVRLDQFAGGPVETKDEAPLSHTVVVQLDRATEFQWRRGGETGSCHLAPGSISVFPAMSAVTAKTRDTAEFIRITFDPQFLLCAAHEVVQPERLELLTIHGVDDPFVRGTALALRAEVQAGYPGGRSYGELLGHTLAAHLVRCYSNQPSNPPQAGTGGLPRVKLRRAIEYINEHMAEEISLEALASAVSLSPFHFSRLFKRSTGFAPHQYLIQRRVERAKEMLISSRSTIAQVAIQNGFCDQSHLTAHFKRVYGVAPKAFLRRFASDREAA